MDTLYASRFSIDGATWYEQVADPVDLRVGCELPFWGGKIELTVKPRNRRDEADRRNNHHGHQWLIYDSRNYNIIKGWTREIKPDDGGVRYIITCSGDRHDEEEFTAAVTPTTHVATQLATVIAAAVDVVSVNQTEHFDANATAVNQWLADADGILPVDAVGQLLDMSDSASDVFDYWCQIARADYLYPRKDEARYRKRNPSATPEWTLQRADLARGGAQLTSNIFDVGNTVEIKHNWYLATHDGGDGKGYAFDSSVDFVAAGVQVGDMIYNLTDGFHTPVRGITNNNHKLEASLTVNPRFDDGDLFAVKMRDAATVTATETANYWDRTIALEAPDYNQDQAAQLAALILEQRNSPLLQQQIVVRAPRIRHKSGAMLPQWHLLHRPATVLVQDMEPSMASFDSFLDNEHSFWPIRVDFDYRAMSTAITPNLPNNLDALLRKAGVSPGGMVIDAGLLPGDLPPHPEFQERVYAALARQQGGL